VTDGWRYFTRPHARAANVSGCGGGCVAPGSPAKTFVKTQADAAMNTHAAHRNRIETRAKSMHA
jgi:hypothetical protein